MTKGCEILGDTDKPNIHLCRCIFHVRALVLMSKIQSSYFERNKSALAAIGWINLRRLGESRMVQTSYIWMVLVPIFARTLEHVKSPVKVNLFGAEHLINLTLPFSWYLFYFSALAFACGSLLYRIYCPAMISEFSNFREYMDSGGEGFRLVEEIENTLPVNVIHDTSIWKAFNIAVEKHLGNDEGELGLDVYSRMVRGCRRMPIEGLSSIFFTIRLVVNHTHPKLILTTVFCFGIGIFFLGAVFAQNINFVIIQLNGGVPLLPWLL